jgi:hypothetical protein
MKSWARRRLGSLLLLTRTRGDQTPRRASNWNWYHRGTFKEHGTARTIGNQRAHRRGVFGAEHVINNVNGDLYTITNWEIVHFPRPPILVKSTNPHSILSSVVQFGGNWKLANWLAVVTSQIHSGRLQCTLICEIVAWNNFRVCYCPLRFKYLGSVMFDTKFVCAWLRCTVLRKTQWHSHELEKS